jgi:hypothetical protein
VTRPVNEHPGSIMTWPETWDSRNCVSIKDFAERRVSHRQLVKHVWERGRRR